MTQDSRKRNKRETVIAFNIAYANFLQDNKGHKNVLDYIENQHGGDKDYWAKAARWAGHKCMKRNGIYFFEA